MSETIYGISILLDQSEYRTLINAINLYKVASAILDYAENIEDCEIINNKIFHNLKIRRKNK